MTTYGITSTGFVKKSASVIAAELTAEYKAIYGNDIQTTDGPIAQEIGVFAERESLIWDLAEAVYLAKTRDGASGASLDDVNSLIGVGRLEATRSTVTLTLATIGASDVTIPSGTQVNQASTNTLWETTAAGTIPAAVDTVEDLVCTTIAWQSGNTVRYSFSGSPDLSSVVSGDMFYHSGGAVASNNGLFAITNVNDGSDYIDVTNLLRSDGTGNESGITGAGVITDGYVEIAAQAVNTGANAASFGAIQEINNPISGWDYISNLAAATTGRTQETDTAYRIRAAANTVSTDGGTLAAVKAKLLENTAITAVYARENRTAATDGNGLPEHSQEYTVIGGTDSAVAQIIYDAKSTGANTYGNTSASVTNDYGDSETIYFSRVSEIDIHFDATVTTDSNYPSDGDDQIKAALVAYGATLSNGDDVINSTAYGYITTNVPGILTLTLLQGTSDPPGASTNISISATQVASITTGNIDVTS